MSKTAHPGHHSAEAPSHAHPHHPAAPGHQASAHAPARARHRHRKPTAAEHRATVRRRLIEGFVILAIAGVAGLGFGIAKASAAKGRAAKNVDAGPVTVLTEPVTQGEVNVYLTAIGTVTPIYTSAITSQITGMITSVHYQEGQFVHIGDPLIDIDDRSYQAQLTRDRGTLQKDTKLLAQAKMDLARYQEAWARNAIQKQTLDDQLLLAAQDEGLVHADLGTVQYDEVQVDYCHIKAPVTGRVGLRLVDPGNIVQANGTSPLVVITQQDPITVIFTIAEDEIGQVQDELQRNATLQVDAFDRTNEHPIAAGTLLSLDNQIDATTGTVKLRAVFDNKEGKLFPNQFVNAKLLVKKLPGQTLVPTSAIQHNGSDSFVYVVANDTAQQRKVTPGAADLGKTSVQGVKPGEVVANSSFEKLQATTRVAAAKDPGAVDAGAPGGAP